MHHHHFYGTERGGTSPKGDGNGTSESTQQGGWKNSGYPWTKTTTPERMILPTQS
jgi:hypothetical protein